MLLGRTSADRERDEAEGKHYVAEFDYVVARRALEAPQIVSAMRPRENITSPNATT
jgi:hypothetical protein